ncbi:MAG TPA: hypothetical protein VGJ26_08265, partial [Pirellulales bacterium]
MFVVVTLLALFVADNVTWISDRREFLAEEQANRTADGITVLGSPEEVRAPGLLWLFGERGLMNVEMGIEGLNIENPN